MTGDSSLIGEVAFFIATDLRFSTGGAGDAGLSGIILGGIAPLLTGVEGGNFLSKCSGDSFGPNDTLFLLADGASRCSLDFLFFPVLPFFSEKKKGLYNMPINLMHQSFKNTTLQTTAGEMKQMWNAYFSF